MMRQCANCDRNVTVRLDTWVHVTGSVLCRDGEPYQTPTPKPKEAV